MQGKEHKLMDDIRCELTRHGAKVFRANVGRLFTADGRMVTTGLPVGFPDLFGTLKGGRSFYIEVKVKPNKPSESQVNFIEILSRVGAAAGVAYSVEEALKICEISAN